MRAEFGDPTGILDWTRHGYIQTTSAIKYWDFPVAAGVTVLFFARVINQLRRDRYDMSGGGSGCRWWVYNIMSDMAQKNYIDQNAARDIWPNLLYLYHTKKVPTALRISDSKLMKLFSELPPHCIVLLEDMDAAGMGRRDDYDTDQENKSSSAVTLSGLLNVLNGVSSQEGRVLVMTTNHIEHLDEALIRPGRANKKVHFQLADKKISTRLFLTVFKQTADHKESKHEFGDETIDRLANDLASKMPNQVFSPAEVLSLLLEQKNLPFGAVTSVDNWAAKTKAGSQLKREDSWSRSPGYKDVKD